MNPRRQLIPAPSLRDAVIAYFSIPSGAPSRRRVIPDGCVYLLFDLAPDGCGTHGGGRTPAVAATAFTRENEILRAFAAGFQQHLGKPVELAPFATIRANLGGRSVEGA